MSFFQQFLENNLFFLIIAFFVIILFIFFWIWKVQSSLKKIHQRNEELFAGKKVANLEELILKQNKTLSLLDKDIQELYNISNQINKLANRGIHKTGLIRFNPFQDVGGDQSFAIALLDGKNNGLTISSLYTREGTRVYAKSIIAGQSEKHPLTQEEKEVIKIALENK